MLGMSGAFASCEQLHHTAPPALYSKFSSKKHDEGSMITRPYALLVNRNWAYAHIQISMYLHVDIKHIPLLYTYTNTYYVYIRIWIIHR